MVHRFRQEAQKIGLLGRSDIHRVVTMASIVEKETADPNERPLVAGVYYNRLNRNMTLAADPSVIYAALLAGRYRGTIYASDLQYESPYNTYKYPGLPPGPIANPGVASLQAAMHPKQTDYLYFVSDNNGHHRFARDLEEHARNVAAYRKSVAAPSSSRVDVRPPSICRILRDSDPSAGSMIRSRILGALCILAFLLGETGCLFRTRTVETRTSTAKLETATRQQLVDYINTRSLQDQDSERHRQHCHVRRRREERAKLRSSKRFAATSWFASRICCA